MHLFYICTMIYFTGHSFKKDAQWKAFDLWIKQASRWQRFSGLSHGEWSYWAPRTDLCKCSNLNHLIPPFWPTFHPPKRNMIILTIVRSYILIMFPCENDTPDTLDMSPFGSTRIPPFDICRYTLPMGKPNGSPSIRWCENTQVDGQSVLVARPWHFDGGWRPDQLVPNEW